MQNGGVAPGAFNNFNLIGGLAGGGGANGAGANANVAQQPAENNGGDGAVGPAMEAEDVGMEDVDNANNAAAQGL